MNKFPRSIQANWQPFDRRPTWSVVSSRELAKVLNVSLQTINNWKMREILPEPESHPRLKGNKNYYKISKIRSWLENVPEQDIHWEWANRCLAEFGPFPALPQVEYVVIHAYKLLSVDKPRIPANFTI